MHHSQLLEQKDITKFSEKTVIQSKEILS